MHFLRAVLAMESVIEEFLRSLITKRVPITCVIRDVAMPCAHEPARALGIPIVAFATCAAVGAYIYQNIDTIRDRGFIPIPPPADPSNPSLHPATSTLRPALTAEEEAARARPLTGFSGLSPVMRVEDLPTYLVTHDMSSFALKFFTEIRNPLVPKCDWVLINTFYELEGGAIDALRSDGINACPVGPLVLTPELVMSTSGSGLWIEDAASLDWLDEQPPASVIYVSFGSIVSISLQQVQELARGLETSGHRFLWVVRPDHAQKGEPGNEEFFKSFAERTRGRSLIAPWVPQAEVLAHPATATFLTHCGWNSTLESITAGVPILAWPQNADQKTNACYIANVWKVGLALECHRKDGLVVRSEVAMKVKRMMVLEPADFEVNSLRQQSKRLQMAARKAASPGGSSHRTMVELMDNLKKLEQSRDDKLFKSLSYNA